jgi:hypothetical protein
MAVVQTSSYRYTGLSGDAKPTTGVTIGTRFIETDTGAEFEFTGGTTWVNVSPQTRSPA